MTDPLIQLQVALGDLEPLVRTVDLASRGDAAYSYTGLGSAVIPPTCSAAVVLLIGRFEEFLKESVERALVQFAKASPPVLRSSLSHEVQLKIMRDNLTGAAREKIHGVKRTVSDRISSLQNVANKIIQDAVWGGDAIDTAGNPNSDTVRPLLTLLGISDPWKKIEYRFAIRWTARMQAHPALKSIPSAVRELESILVWRNSVAHSSSSLPAGLRELTEALGYIEDLASSIDETIRTELDATIQACGSLPARWT